MIVRRYFFREFFYALLAMTSVLLFLFLAQQFVHFLGQAAEGKFSSNILFQLIGLQIPGLLSLLLPLCLYLALIVALGRLYADAEMTAWFACGLSVKKLLTFILTFAVCVGLLVAMLTLWYVPRIHQTLSELLEKAKRVAVVEVMQPGHFKQSTNGRQIYYAEKISRDRLRADYIFMAQAPETQESGDSSWSVMLAKAAEVVQSRRGEDQLLILSDGYRYSGTPGEKDYQVVQFSRYFLPLQNNDVPPVISSRNAIPTMALFYARGENPRYLAELHWRLALPISVLLLSFLALPLSALKPRQGRYARLLPAILIYVVYVNFIFVGKAWLSKGKIPAVLGLWWVHAAMLLFVVMVYWDRKRKRFL